jgi:hypothetical protein
MRLNNIQDLKDLAVHVLSGELWLLPCAPPMALEDYITNIFTVKKHFLIKSRSRQAVLDGNNVLGSRKELKKTV